MKRANWIGAPGYFNLNHACRVLAEGFGFGVYLVGSALEHRDFRDVDVRCILTDDAFDQLFPGDETGGARWSILNAALSEWLSSRSGLPVDFQFQAQTKANRDYPDGKRSAIGIISQFPPGAAR